MILLCGDRRLLASARRTSDERSFDGAVWRFVSVDRSLKATAAKREFKRVALRPCLLQRNRPQVHPALF